jgi:hypothetical protein
MLKIRFNRWRAALATATVAATALIAACGGGGDSAGTALQPTETATDYTQGVITGFGSVIVGGVRYDDSNSDVSDDDGGRRDRSELKLGMTVQVDGAGLDRTAGTARALRIRFGSEIVGPVTAVDTAASTATVLGQTVVVTTSTVFDSSLAGGLSAVAVGDILEVHGIPDATANRIVATRIEEEAAPDAYRLRGVVSALNTTNKTFMIGSELISYADVLASDVPGLLADGQMVRVRLQTTQVGGAWVAINLRSGVRGADSARPHAHVEGVITVFTSTTDFEINGLKVNAANALFEDGTTGIVLGARVEVEGTLTDGVLVATKVEIEDRRDSGRRELELRGEMGNLDATAKTFALRGVTVWYGASVEYRDGTEASLANGRRVEVKGVLSEDRTRLEARRIEIK